MPRQLLICLLSLCLALPAVADRHVELILDASGSMYNKLEAPKEVAAGSSFEVQWTGPDGKSDYITIVPKGAPAGVYLHYVYTQQGATVTLRAPEEPGDYEVRYQSDRVRDVILGTRPIRVR